MSLRHLGDQFHLGPIFLLGPDHDSRAVSVISTEVDRAVATQLLKTHPDVSLDVFHEVSQVDVPVGIR